MTDLDEKILDHLSDVLSEFMIDNVAIDNRANGYAYERLGMTEEKFGAMNQAERDQWTEFHLDRIHDLIGEYHNILLAHCLAANLASQFNLIKTKGDVNG